MLRVLAFGLFFVSLSSPAVAQVRIEVSVPVVGTETNIHARVLNKTKQPITICLDLGYHSIVGNIFETTPQPFVVEQQPKDSWTWNIVHNRLDVGEFQTDVIKGGETVDFPFRPAVPGHLRLVLNYWVGSVSGIGCAKGETGARKAKSEGFDVAFYYIME